MVNFRASEWSQVAERIKTKTKANAYPHVSFGRFKNEKSEHVLLSEFSGPMRIGGHEAKGQLLEITFTTNLNTASELKEEIDHIMDSVHLEE